ncbi:MAG: hypothetical protein COA42_21200 [Alteromonadaceae bacterium]|nr:MAG: hypothetical protein COA42_21200 [Alteromonadaceae bacterium]
MRLRFLLKYIALSFLSCGSVAISHAGAGGEPSRLRFSTLDLQEFDVISFQTTALEDAQGFMWFGGNGGLGRYDGYELKLFKNQPRDVNSLEGNYVRDIRMDTQGRMWVITSSGLNRYDPNTEGFTRFIDIVQSPDMQPASYIECVELGDQNYFWVGTGQGLSRFNIETGQTEQITLKNSQGVATSYRIIDIYKDRQGMLWLGTYAQGLIRFNPKDGASELYVYNLDIAGQGANSAQSEPGLLSPIISIAEDQRQRLWFGTRGAGLFMFDRHSGIFTAYRHDPKNPNSLGSNIVQRLLIDRQNNFLIATNGGGMNHFNQDINRPMFYSYRFEQDNPKSIGSDKVFNIYQDLSDNLWLGYFPSGVSKLAPYASNFRSYHYNAYLDNSLSHKSVISLAEDKVGKLWVGTERGLNYLSLKADTVVRYQSKIQANSDDAQRLGDRLPNSQSGTGLAGFDNKPIETLTFDSRNNFWVGTWKGGLYRREYGSDTFVHYYDKLIDKQKSLDSLNVRHVKEDRQGRIWVATDAGLLRYMPFSDDFKVYNGGADKRANIVQRDIHRLYENSRGEFWLGTEGGIALLDRDTGKFQYFYNRPGDAESLSFGNIWAILEDSRGNMWFGRNRLNRDNNGRPLNFTTYGVDDGLADTNVTGIVEDQTGMIWFSTAKGLSRFNPKTETFNNYSKRHGLAGNVHNRPAYAQLSNGELAFGSTEGLSIFRPTELFENKKIPPVVLTKFSLFNKPVVIGGEGSPLQQSISQISDLVLNHKQSIFSLEFAALNYHLPELNRYSYRLEGFEKDWTEPSARRTVTYMNLDPGRYTFRVRGANNDMTWNAAGASINVRILPAWWRSWWAYSLYFIIGGAIFWLIFYTFINKNQARIAQREKNARTQFFANMSHEIRTPLTAIKGYAELIEGKMPSNSDVHEHAKTIISSSNHLIQIVNDVLNLSKFESGKMQIEAIVVDVPKMIQDTYNFFYLSARRKSLYFEVDIVDEIPRNIISDPLRMRQILINLCSNAIKFTAIGGVTLTVSCDRKNERLLFSIKDTGVGMTQAQCDKLFRAFEQGDVSTTRHYGGTGLGLYLSQKIALKLGGEISVESALNKGSLFGFSISSGPLDQTGWVSSVDCMFKAKPPKATADDQPLCGNVLFAEDNVDNQILVRSMLEGAKVNLSVVSNGQEALAAIGSDNAEYAFDLVLMDLRMPVMSGVSAARELLNRGINIPLIAVSADISGGDIEEYMALGFIAFIEKPFSRDKFYATVTPYLNKASASRPEACKLNAGLMISDAATLGADNAVNVENNGGEVEAASQAIKPGENGVGARCGKILLAEDTLANQKLIQYFVKQIGMDIDIVSDGQQVLDYMKNNTVDLILMDMYMPVMDGKTATMHLRAQGCTVPIYALTAEDRPEKIHDYMLAGCNHYLSKPIDFPELKRVLLEYSNNDG